MDMIDWLQSYLTTDNTKLVYVLALILTANLIDFTIGWVNAKFNPVIPFSSAKAIFGIARKLILFIVLVYAIPVALLMPDGLGIGALYILYMGYLLSEINSILHHFKLTTDDKSMDPFIEFFKGLMNKKKG